MAKTLLQDIKEKTKETFENPSHTRIFLNEFGVDKNADQVAEEVVQKIYTAIATEIKGDKRYPQKDIAECVRLLNEPQEIEEVSTHMEGARMADIVRKVLQQDPITEANFAVDADGKVVGIENVDLQKRITDALDKEIKEDPLKMGYKSMTKEQALGAMRGGRMITTRTKKTGQPKCAEILHGIPFAPNIIDSEIVKNALNLK